MSAGSSVGRPWRALLLLVAALLGPPHAAGAHDIPSEVTVQAWVKPDGGRLRLLVRVPLRAMRDVEFPQTGPGYLDVARADAALRNAAILWIANAIEVEEGDARLQPPGLVAARASLPSDTSFASFDQALAHVTGPGLPPSTRVSWDQLSLDALFEYPIRSEQSRFSVHPGFGRLGGRVVTALRYLPAGGAVRAFEFDGDPGLVRLDPRWHQAAGRFVASGFRHILDGADHLLFLFCLVIPFRRFRALVPVVTAFTVAHSITLIAAAYGLGPGTLWFPPLIETLIAASIVYMAIENIAGATSVPRRWMIAFAFGLVHGFGFSFALQRTLQFAGAHLLTSLLSFNIGVELGQLLLLVLFIPALDLAFRFVVADRIGTIIVSALVAHTAWHWMTDRAGVLRQYRFEWEVPRAAVMAASLRWLAIAVLLAGIGWLLRLAFLKPGRRGDGVPSE